jgi:hypothetical protein
MLALAAIGAMIAGVYGAAHDQVSYAISPEYFTGMKFQQFGWADVGLPARAHASEVGFLATWWAGLFAGWFLARAGLDGVPRPAQRRTACVAFGIVLLAAVLIGAACAGIGAWSVRESAQAWSDWTERLDLHDPRGFAVVAWLHAGGYAGALLGLIVAIAYVRRAAGPVRHESRVR